MIQTSETTLTASPANWCHERPLRRQGFEIDVERYQRYLDSSGLTEDQKSEFLAALWSVVLVFIDLGYGVHPAQNTLPEDSIRLELRSIVSSSLLPSETEFKHVAGENHG